jgi:TolB-like protein/Flp pilus assembly protein TadD
MPSESGTSVRLQIGHVLFMDLVGYSTLLLDEQRQFQKQLTDIVRDTQQVRIAKEAGKLIGLPVGDGMALVFFDSPEAPVRCAIEISKKLKEHPQLKLRMGIHSGPINEVRDVNDRTNVAGNGINLARRVMDCGDGGHILISKRVAEDLAQSRRWTPYLHDLGECAVKHSVPVFLVNFYGDGFGNPESPKMIQHAQAERAAKTAATGTRPRFRGVYIAIAAAIFFVAGTALSIWFYSKQTPAASLPQEKSIAVLPFQNFSPEKDNAFFADGIQDDILTSLAKIKDLRVISRSSVMAFRDAAGQNVRHIGRKLRVANILEGSVRKEGDRVVVNVQLIDARNSRQIWANRYDRTLADSLGLQGELATEIADTLSATLSEEEKARVITKPTQNADAYVFYLRANQLSGNPDALMEDYKAAEQLYTQAIALDPGFAVAHARLASTCAQIFHFDEPLESWKNKARAEAETALRLQPDLAEAHLALGQCFYWIDQNYERALEELDIASRLSPNNSDVRRLSASIRRRQGKWQEALEGYERVVRLDPQNATAVRELVFTNTAMRRWPEAAHWARRLRAIAPESLVGKIQGGYVDFWWKGDTRLLKSFLSEVPLGVDPDGVVTAGRWDLAMLNRDYVAAKRALNDSNLKDFSYMNGAPTPRSFLEGCIAIAHADTANAQKYLQDAQSIWENAVKEAPESALRHANLGLLYAFMGRKEDAIREGRRAVELKPESKDAFDGAIMNGYLALIYARLGENDLAIPLIERLRTTPGAVDSADYSITVNDLKHRWEWDSLRSDPRFQKLIENDTPSELNH